MVGTAPIFYHIVVTEKLLGCVSQGTYPSEETVVHKYVPHVPHPYLYGLFGIRRLENRHVVFRCFEAFKPLIVRPSSNCPSHATLTENLYSLKHKLALTARLQKGLATCCHSQTPSKVPGEAWGEWRDWARLQEWLAACRHGQTSSEGSGKAWGS